MLEKTKKSIIEHFNLAFCLAGLVLMLICLLDSTRILEETPWHIASIEPYKIEQLNEDTTEYFFDVSDYAVEYNSISFYSCHQKVYAFSNEEMIYSFATEGGFWTKSPGSVYNFIDINDKMTTVEVSVVGVYNPEYYDKELTFYIGSASEIYQSILSQAMPSFIASVLIILLAAIAFVYYEYMKKKQIMSRELFYLSVFAFFVGTWSANESNAVVLMMPNRIFDALVPYMSLMLMVPPFIMFVDSYLGINDRIFKRIIVLISDVEYLAFIAMHFLKIREFRENLVIIQWQLLLAVTYMLVAVLYKLKKKQYSRRVFTCAIGLLLFVTALLTDFGAYSQTMGDTDIFGRYVVLIFMMLLVFDLIKTSNELISKGRRAKELEIFAITDRMTGLYNRNAYEMHLCADFGNFVMAIVMDVNNLKHCNDTYGHEAGDAYITMAANLFEEAFSKYGHCYRTGGDEFCCIVPDSRNVNVDNSIRLIHAKLENINMTQDLPYYADVAIGYARKQDYIGMELEDLIKRADDMMYENKMERKELRPLDA